VLATSSGDGEMRGGAGERVAMNHDSETRSGDGEMRSGAGDEGW
jgi:hypothetical protein